MAFGDADASTPAFVKANSAGKNVTTASFTPPNGALLVAHADHDTAGGNVTSSSTLTSSDGASGTGVTAGGWTAFAEVSKASDGTGFANGHLKGWWAVATGVAMTVTTTGTNANNPAGLYVRVVTGADTTTPIDVVAEGTNTNAVISQSITTVTDGARAFLAAIDWNLAANMAAGTNQTTVVADGIGAPDMRVFVGVQNAVTSPAGSVTMSTSSPSTGNTNNWFAYALRPAAGGAANLNLGNDALSAAGNSAGLLAGLQAGNDALAVTASSITATSSLSSGNAASSVAGNAVTLQARPAAGNAASSVGAFDIAVTSGSALQLGSAASGVSASSVVLRSSPSSGNAASSVAASSVTLTSSLSSGNGALAVGAFGITVTGGATGLAVGNAIIGVGAFGITLSGGTAVSGVAGSWYGLLDILNEIRATAAEQRATPPTACPRDGEPLQTARGTLWCRFCGWKSEVVSV